MRLSEDEERRLRVDAVPIIAAVLGIAQAVALVIWIYFLWAADRAMDKSGIGDYQTFSRFTSYSEFVFVCFCVMWLASLVAALCAAPPWRRKLLLRFGLGGPAAVVLAWLVAVLLPV